MRSLKVFGAGGSACARVNRVGLVHKRAAARHCLAVQPDAPLHHITQHIVQSPSVGLFLGDLVRLEVRVVQVPCEFVQRFFGERFALQRACPRGVLPLRFRGQAVRLARHAREPLAVPLRRHEGHPNRGVALVAEAAIDCAVGLTRLGNRIRLALLLGLCDVLVERIGSVLVPSHFGLANPEALEFDNLCLAGVFGVGQLDAPRRDVDHLELDGRAGNALFEGFWGRRQRVRPQRQRDATEAKRSTHD